MATLLRLRATLLVSAAVALVGACASADEAAPVVGGGAPTTQGGGPTTTALDSPAERGGSKSGGIGGDNRGGGSGGRRADADSDAELRQAAQSQPGAFAGVLLAPGAAKALVLDVLVQNGAQADTGVIAQVRQLLESASGKPVTVRGPTALDASGNVHTAEEIRDLADAQGRPAQGNGTAVVHLLYLDGSFSSKGALGVAVRGDTVGIFPDEVADASTPLVSRSRIERAVVTHELGHTLGLVDLFLDRNRDDPEHPGHSINPRSVMYWAVESDLVAQVLGGPPPVDFDEADRTDLARIREGATG